MELRGIELQHTEFHGISLYSIVLHGITWFWFVLHGIVCWTLCSITYFRYVKLWGLARRVFTLFLISMRFIFDTRGKLWTDMTNFQHLIISPPQPGSRKQNLSHLLTNFQVGPPRGSRGGRQGGSRRNGPPPQHVYTPTKPRWPEPSTIKVVGP